MMHTQPPPPPSWCGGGFIPLSLPSAEAIKANAVVCICEYGSSCILPEVAGTVYSSCQSTAGSGLLLFVSWHSIDTTFLSERNTTTSSRLVLLLELTQCAAMMQGILAITEEPLVSVDFRCSDVSSTVDASLTMVMGDDMVKVVAWYDNEWGYSQRVVDLAEIMAQKWQE